MRTGASPKPYYELSAASPAINAGLSISGFPVADGQTDLGAYEFAGTAGQGDTDGDGQSDAAEAIAGTSPADPNDVLKIVEVQKDWETNFRLRGQRPGKTYAIEWTVGGFTSWTEQGRVQATAGRAAGTVDAPAGSASMHARVRVVQ